MSSQFQFRLTPREQRGVNKLISATNYLIYCEPQGDEDAVDILDVCRSRLVASAETRCLRKWMQERTVGVAAA